MHTTAKNTTNVGGFGTGCPGTTPTSNKNKALVPRVSAALVDHRVGGRGAGPQSTRYSFELIEPRLGFQMNIIVFPAMVVVTPSTAAASCV